MKSRSVLALGAAACAACCAGPVLAASTVVGMVGLVVAAVAFVAFVAAGGRRPRRRLDQPCVVPVSVSVSMPPPTRR